MRSSISWSGRFIVVLAGALLLLVGWGVRAHERNYPDKVDEWIERPDGTIAIYQYSEDEGSTRYDIVDVDESTAVVYAVEERFDVRVEVFRGERELARAEYGTGEEEAPLYVEMIEVDESTAAVYLGDESRDVRVELKRGTVAEVDEWFMAAEERALMLEFEGSRAEAEAWVDAQTDARSDRVSSIVLTAGAVTILIGLAVGWTGTAAAEPHPRLDHGLGVTGIVVAGCALAATIIEASNPGEIGIMRELAVVLGMLAFVMLVGIAVRHREVHRGGEGSNFVAAGVWIAIGLTGFGFLQSLDPMLNNPEEIGLLDAAVPDDVLFFPLLFAVPLALVAFGLLRDRRGPVDHTPAATSTGVPPRGAAPVT